MKKIVLICNLGMSTSLLVTNMKKAAADRGVDVDINAYAIGEASTKGADADVILLGPQIRFQLAKVKAIFPDKPVDVIDMKAYGTVDGKKALDEALKLIGE